MSADKILFLSPFFSPEIISTGKYNGALAVKLMERGAALEVVCSHPFYPAWKPDLSQYQFAGMSIHRAGSRVRYPRSMVLRRLVLEIWYAGWATCQAWRLRGHVGTVVAVFPPSLFFLVVPFLLTGSQRKIGIVHDLQGVLGASGEGWAKRALGRIVRAIEKKSFRFCDRLIVLSQTMADRVVADYEVRRDKIEVHYPFVTVDPRNRAGTKLAGLFPSGRVHVVYSGALGKKQNPSGLIAFFKTAALRFPHLDFHVFSDGPIFEELRRAARQDPADRLSFHHLVSESDLEELYTRSDIQVVPQLDDTADTCLPSKLPNILAMGCFILGICPPGTDLANILEQTDCGTVAGSWHTDELIAGLGRAVDRVNAQSRAQRQALVSRTVGKQFSLDALADAVLGTSAGGQICEDGVELQSRSTVAGSSAV